MTFPKLFDREMSLGFNTCKYDENGFLIECPKQLFSDESFENGISVSSFNVSEIIKKKIDDETIEYHYLGVCAQDEGNFYHDVFQGDMVITYNLKTKRYTTNDCLVLKYDDFSIDISDIIEIIRNDTH